MISRGLHRCSRSASFLASSSLGRSQLKRNNNRAQLQASFQKTHSGKTRAKVEGGHTRLCLLEALAPPPWELPAPPTSRQHPPYPSSQLRASQLDARLRLACSSPWSTRSFQEARKCPWARPRDPWPTEKQMPAKICSGGTIHLYVIFDAGVLEELSFAACALLHWAGSDLKGVDALGKRRLRGWDRR